MKITNDFCDTKFPKVGERLMKSISFSSTFNGNDKLEPCIVVYVNKKKNYYMVEFIDTKLRECYKFPEVDEIEMFKSDYRRAFGRDPKGVYVYESGIIYPSISECARDLGVNKGTISRHIHGELKHVKGYHIYMFQ